MIYYQCLLLLVVLFQEIETEIILVITIYKLGRLQLSVLHKVNVGSKTPFENIIYTYIVVFIQYYSYRYIVMHEKYHERFSKYPSINFDIHCLLYQQCTFILVQQCKPQNIYTYSCLESYLKIFWIYLSHMFLHQKYML